MADTPTRTDTPPPPKPPEQSLRPSPEFQQKLDNFRAEKEARQDSGQAVDHRAAKAENLAAREAARSAPKTENAAPQPRQADSTTQHPQRSEGDARQPQRSAENVAPQQRPEGVPPQQRAGEGVRPDEASPRNGSQPEPLGLRPSPEMQQKLDDFRAQKEARQDAGQAVDHRAAKAENEAARNAPKTEGQQTQQRPEEPAAAKPAEPRNSPDAEVPKQRVTSSAETGPSTEARNAPAEKTAPEPKTAAAGDQGGGRSGDTSPGAPPAADDGDRRAYSAKHLDPAADLRGRSGEQNAAGETGEQPQGKHGRPETGSEYTGPERRQHEAQHVNPADDQRKPTPETAPQKVESPETMQRLSELRNEGHGPQRHLDPTVSQLQDRLGTPIIDPATGRAQLRDDGHVRAEGKIDPMTGTTVDGVHGGAHQCGPIATSLDSGADYVAAEKYLRQQVEATGVPIASAPISDILGPGGHERITGVYHDPANPGQVKRADFEGGEIFAVYDRAPNGDLSLNTMYANPAPFRP